MAICINKRQIMATNSPKNIQPIKIEAMKTRLAKMINARERFANDLDDMHVYISTGNRKTGFAVPSVSLIPVADCANCASCSRLCYDLRNDCIYNGVTDTRARNSAIARYDLKRYFYEISGACKAFRFFRWHIGGDILNYAYLLGMIQTAIENPQTTFLAFTKCYDLVNGYILENGSLPSNLQVIFSAWPGATMANPYNMPTSSPVFADGSTAAPAGAIECPGNCSACAVMGSGCWGLKAGEGVKFNAH
jgi:hypothetical protein